MVERAFLAQAGTDSGPRALSSRLTANAQFVTTGEDALRINVVHNCPGVTVSLSGRYVVAGGTSVGVFRDSFVPPSTVIQNTHVVPLPEGTLLNLYIRAVDQRCSPGQCFARVDIIRGTGSGDVVGTLISGYIGSWGGLGWPGSILGNPWDGPGWVHAEFDFTLPAGTNPRVLLPHEAKWRILGVAGVLTCSGVVATRTPYLRIFQSGTLIWVAPSSIAQGAGSAVFHAWGAGLPIITDPLGGAGMGALPAGLEIVTTGGDDGIVDISTNGLQAGDQWSSWFAQVEEWRNPVSTDT